MNPELAKEYGFALIKASFLTFMITIISYFLYISYRYVRFNTFSGNLIGDDLYLFLLAHLLVFLLIFLYLAKEARNEVFDIN